VLTGETSNQFFFSCGWFLALSDFPFVKCSGQGSVSTQGVFNAPSRAASTDDSPRGNCRPPVCAHDAQCEAQHIKLPLLLFPGGTPHPWQKCFKLFRAPSYRAEGRMQFIPPAAGLTPVRAIIYASGLILGSTPSSGGKFRERA
jgi:hypothetical protein